MTDNYFLKLYNKLLFINVNKKKLKYCDRIFIALYQKYLYKLKKCLTYETLTYVLSTNKIYS